MSATREPATSSPTPTSTVPASTGTAVPGAAATPVVRVVAGDPPAAVSGAVPAGLSLEEAVVAVREAELALERARQVMVRAVRDESAAGESERGLARRVTEARDDGTKTSQNTVRVWLGKQPHNRPRGSGDRYPYGGSGSGAVSACADS